MARITNIDDLIPEDIELVYRGQTYVISGDVAVPDVLKMFRAIVDIAAVQTTLDIPEDATDEEIKEASAAAEKDANAKLERVQKEILALINANRPADEQLKKSPFGQRSLPIVLQEVLGHLMPAWDPRKAAAARPNSRTASSRKRSSPSSPSRRRPKR